MKKLFFVCIVLLTYIACKKTPETLTKEQTISNPIEKPLDTTIKVTIEEPQRKTIRQLKQELNTKGFKTLNYVDDITKDTILMQQYYIAFLKRGLIRGQNEEEESLLQKAHLKHLAKMYKLGYADISGPFDDNGKIREITIYNVPSKSMADSLASADPMVKAGRLNIEIHPWWAAKGSILH